MQIDNMYEQKYKNEYVDHMIVMSYACKQGSDCTSLNGTLQDNVRNLRMNAFL